MNDQQLFDTVNKITNTKSLFSMTGFSIKKSPYRNRRDELIKTACEDINKLRIGTNYKEITPRLLAIRINRNAFLKSDDELDLVLKKCREKRSYKYLFWLIK